MAAHLVALLLALAPWLPEAAAGGLAARASAALLPGDTAWLNASAQCGENLVCVVGPEERWLLKSDMSVDGLRVQGIFKWDDTQPNLVLRVGWIIVEKGGVLQVGSSREPIGLIPGVRATIYFKKTVQNRHEIYGDRFLIGDGSSIKIQGLPMPRTWTLLSRSVANGTTELFLKDDPVQLGWQVGDEVGVATTNTAGGALSTRHRIAAIQPATDEELSITAVNAGAQEPHLPAANAVDGNVGSLWSSYLGASTQQWLRLDLAAASNVTRIMLCFTEPRYAPVYRIEVQTSAGGPWVLAASATDGRNGWQEVQVNSDNVQAIRMFADYSAMWNRGYKGERGAEPAWSGLWLNEVRVFGRKLGVVPPTVIVLDTPIRSDRMGGSKDVAGHSFEMAAEVVNLERSVLLTGDHDDFHESFQGFHTMMMNNGVINVRYTRLEYCGQRDKMGKYCLHLHQVGNCPDCAFQGNAVVDSQQVGITVHGVHQAFIDQNTLWDCRAAGIYTEGGNEMHNIISNNVIICSWWETCAVSWQNRDALQNAGMYVVGMTNKFLYNRIVGYQHGTWTVGGIYPYGQGYVWGKVCPQFMPFEAFRGNVHHDCQRFGLYLDNQHPRMLVRDEDGLVVSGCQEFKADGSDNGLNPPNLIEDSFEWHNMFVGQYSMGDISLVRFTSVNNAHSLYWKASKNFADGVSYHLQDSVVANDMKDPYGRLQVYGPSGPFTFKVRNLTFLGGPVGDAALCAGQHCGLGGAGGPCDVQYQLEDLHWEKLMPWQKKVKFGVNSASFGFVQPILLAKDGSLGGFSAMVSQHLNGFTELGCQQQDWQWDNAFACNASIRRLNFWSNVDQGNLTLQGPGYRVTPNWALPAAGLNAGLMQFEPMHRGYGLPVLAGGSYTVGGTWRGDVAVEFSDRVLAEYFGPDVEHLNLTVLNGTSCDLTSHDPRNFLSPLGIAGQAEGVQLEENVVCMIHGEPLPPAPAPPGTAPTTAPRGRATGQCQFINEPSVKYMWDPYCFFGGLGCFADGKNPECAFCGMLPFRACSTTTSTTPATTTTTYTTTMTTTTASTLPITTTTTMPDRTIKNLLGGMCLAASTGDVAGVGFAELGGCNPSNISQQWTYDIRVGRIKNLLCLHNELGADVLLQACIPLLGAQQWQYNTTTGQIRKPGGMCLEVPNADSFEVQMADCLDVCSLGKGQQWSIGSWQLPSIAMCATTGTSTTTTTIALATTTTVRPAPVDFVWYRGYNCSSGKGSNAVPGMDQLGVLTWDECKEACASDSLCEGAVVGSSQLGSSCSLRMGIDMTQCLQGTTAGLWLKVVPIPMPVTTTVVTTTGTTTTTTVDMTIQSFLGTCLSCPSGAAAGAAVEMQPCSPTDSAQQWSYIVDGGKIQNRLVCLDLPTGGTVQTSACANTASQRWTFDVTTGQIRLGTGLCLQAALRAPDPAAVSQQVQVLICNAATKSQLWNIGAWQLSAGSTTAPAGATTSVAAATATTTTTTTATTTTATTTTATTTSSTTTAPRPLAGLIRAVEGSKCLDAPFRSTDGGKLHMWDCSKDNYNQLWAYNATTGVIKNQFGICIDSLTPTVVNGTVQMWSCYPAVETQKWFYDWGTSQIRSHTGICLGAPGRNTNGGLVAMVACNTTDPAQQWRIVDRTTFPLPLLLDAGRLRGAVAAAGRPSPPVPLSAGSSQRRRRRSITSHMSYAEVRPRRWQDAKALGA